MFRQRRLLPLLGLLTILGATESAHAQRGRGGMARPGGGGMARPGGGGMARPAGGGMTRPAMPQNRPAMARPNMPMNRPNMGSMTRPNLPANRPNLGNMTRPNLPGAGRPTTLPGQIGGIGGNRPGLGNRPTPLPGGGIGGNRPGLGGDRPGLGADRPGIGIRPTPLPGGGIGGNRPGLGGGGGWAGNRPGGGLFPGEGGGWGGNRPGGGGGGIQWPGGGNRPGGGGWAGGNGNRPWGNGNRPWGNGNNNWGIGNGNWGNGNNINTGNIGSGNTSNYFGGNRYVNVGGGGGWGGGWGGYSSGYNGAPIINNNVIGGGGWGGGWASPYYGNWYRGGWGGNGFWSGFGTGALTSFGLGALGSLYGGYGYGGWGLGGLGYGYPMGMGYASSYGVYDYFPTWGMSNFSGWGLGSLASNWLYSGYTNPYNATLIAAQPAQTTAVYDYSQPINVAATPPAASVAESTEQVFSAARDAFKAGDYQRALDLADQVLKQTPNVPVVHEFRALALFALRRYDEAAAVDYAVLSSGPGWNWATLAGLYPDVETYTDQLRALEAHVRSNPGSAPAQFLLGYHYLVQGHKENAGSQFAKVVQLQPQDQLSASFVKALKKVSEQPAATSLAAATQPAGNAPAPASASDRPRASAPQEEPPPPPPAGLVGTWKAQPAPDLSITLTLQADGQFAWEVDAKGQKQTLTGQSGFKDSTLALLQAEGPPLVGKVSDQDADRFVFTPAGVGGKAAGLTFKKS